MAKKAPNNLSVKRYNNLQGINSLREFIIKLKRLIILLTFLWLQTGLARTTTDFQTWGNVTVLGTFYKDKNGKFKYWLEGQERIGDDSSRFSQTLGRVGIGYTITENSSLWFGYAWLHTGKPLAVLRPVNENRIWQQWLWIKINPRIELMNRVRTEQRYFNDHRKTAYRIREFFKVALPFQCCPDWYFVSSDEIFWHQNNFVGNNGRGFDQNRFFIGLGYRIHRNVNLETGYMNQYIHRFDVPNFLSNILSINFYVNLF